VTDETASEASLFSSERPGSASEASSEPLLRVVNPDATPEEVAALVAVFAALRSGEAAPPRRRTPEWSAPRRGLRRTHPSGPGGWRSSAMPR
jgi:hypothetical protein